MAVDPVNAIGMAAAAPAQTAAETTSTSFADWLGQQMTTTNESIVQAEQQVQQLAVGDAENLHQVISALSKAEISFDLLTQVRNRVLEGFQEIMRMQI